MAWFREHRSAMRLCVLALLIIALLGPWAYDAVMVPDEYACGPSLVRLGPGFCGDPMTGWFVIGSYGLNFFSVLWALISGARPFAEAGRELLTALAFLPLLPVLSSVLLIARGGKRSFQVFHWIALGLLASLMVWFIRAEVPSVISLRTWGPWLYLATLALGIIGEGWLLVSRSRFRERGENELVEIS